MLFLSRNILHILAGGALFLLAACQDTDPLTRGRGDWKPASVNEDNLAAEIVDPADLATGVADEGGDADQAAKAIDRLKTDKVKPIEHVGLAIVGGGS